MLPTASQKFPHRHNMDGSFDSICTVCLATVATVRREEQLYREESAHVCDLVRLYQLARAETLPETRVCLGLTKTQPRVRTQS
jgi:hypothetical protein